MSASAYLNAQQAAHPELAEHYSKMADLYERRLWHQLTMKLEEVVALPTFQTGDLLIQLYHNFINDFEHKLNALKLGHIVVAVSSRYGERSMAVSFMESVVTKMTESKMQGHEEPVLYLQMHVALLHLHDGNTVEAKRMVTQDGKAALDALPTVDPSVNAAFHYVSSQYYKSRQDFAEFYKSGMLYLAYISSDSLPAETRRDLAVDLALAALLGENVYNFAELLAHPIIKSLDGTAFAWLHEVLVAFNDGDLHLYDTLCNKYADALNAQPALVANERKLREKITILCLLQIIFQLPAENREISLADIASKTKLNIDGVEYLLMKALSAHLIEGIIDQVASKVHITWVQPRVLLRSQVKELCGRLDGWIEKVHSVGEQLQEEIPQLVSMA